MSIAEDNQASSVLLASAVSNVCPLAAEESVKEHADQLVPAVEKLVARGGLLFEGTSMPASDTKWLPAAA